jgi:hypothetical protein
MKVVLVLNGIGRLKIKVMQYIKFSCATAYHRFLKCLVAIELKTGHFRPEYAGKMDFYLEVLNDRERASDDNPSIGIILCAEKDRLEVEFSLRSKANPIGVATYQLYPQAPEEYRGLLPTDEDWQRLLETTLLDVEGKEEG